MKTTRQSDLKLPIITYLICVIHVNGAILNIAASHQYPIVSTTASLTCHIPSFIGGAEWIKNTSSLTQCNAVSCFPSGSGDLRYRYSVNTTAMTVTISSLDIALDEDTWSCTYDATDTGAYNLTVYKPPSNLTIIGPAISTVYDDVTVYLSVSTGCIHPIDAAHYIVEWRYVEAASVAENAFGTIIAKNFTSDGSCSTYEGKLKFTLYLTNKMNTGNTSLYISQIKMTFTMAGINVPATLNVAYNVTPNGTASPSSSTDSPPNKQCQPSESQLVLGLGLGLGLGIQCVFIIIVVVIFKCTGKNHEDNPQETETDGTKPEQVPLEPTEVSSVQTCVGSEAKFSFKLTEDSNESAVLIKNKSHGVVMTARGKEGRSGDPIYKGRVKFTGNTDQKLISFILRDVTLSDAGIYIAVHSDANTIIGCQMLIVKGCKRARNLGLVLGLGLGIIFIVCCIIIASLILTGTTPCKNELGLGLGLGSGMPCVITIIIALIFTFCSFPLFKAHEQVPLEPTEISSVQTCVGSEANFSFMLTEDSNESAVLIKNKSGGIVMTARGKEGSSDDPVYKDRVNFTGNTNQKLISFILRNVTLSDVGIYIAVHSDPNIIIGCQVLIVKDTKGKTKNPGPPTVHTRTQNKVDPNTRSKQTNDRQQPVPPANTGFEDTPTFRPLPTPPQNGEFKDRNVRGISATIGDTPDLASETPRPNRLRPLTPKQATVQKEDASEEPKKKRKKKKKKDQMNVETPEEENGETDMRVN